MKIIGWDVSTSAIGICVMDGSYRPTFHVLFPKGNTHLEKHQSAAAQVRKFMTDVSPVGGITHVIEQHLGGFSGGFSSAQTKMALCAMNAVVSFVLSDTGKLIHILPVSTKAITGLKILPDEENKKEAVIRMARAACADFPYKETKAGNWVKGTDDMADAWLLAIAGGRILSGAASLPDGRKKKARVDRKKAGAAPVPGAEQG